MAGLLGLRLCAMALTFLQALTISHGFGPASFGLLSFTLSVGAIMVLVLSLGFDQILMRDLAKIGPSEAAVSGEWRSVFGFITRFVTAFTLLVSILVLAILLLTDLGGQYRLPMIVMVIFVPLVTLRKFVDALLVGAKRIGASLLGTQIVFPLLMVLGTLFAVALNLNGSLTALMTIYGVATILSTLLALLLATRMMIMIRPLPGTMPADLSRPAMMSSGFYFALVSLGFVVGQNIDVILVGIMATPQEVAVVRVASRLAEVIAVMRSIVSVQYRPEIAEASGRGHHARLQQIATRLAVIYVVTGLPLYILGMIFADKAMLLFGSEYTTGAWALRGYLTGVFFALLCGPADTVLALSNREATAARALWMGLAANVVLDLALIPYFGANGAAIANMTSLTIMGLWCATAAARVLRIHCSIFSLLRRPVA